MDRELITTSMEGRYGPGEIDAAYRRRLDEMGLVDLDALIPRALEALRDAPAERRRPYTRLLVDEFQDIDPSQLELLDALRGPGAEVFVIGDPDQSIYRFRGADPACFERLAAWGPVKTLGLRTNHRSTSNVQRAAALLLGRRPAAGDLSTGRDPEIRLAVRPTAAAEAEYVAHAVERLVGGVAHFSFNSDRVETADGAEAGFGDVAVLARTSALLDAADEALGRLGVPVHRPGRAADEVEELRRDLLALAAAAADREDRLAYLRLDAVPGDGSAIERAVRLREAAAAGRPVLDAAWEILARTPERPERRAA